MLQQAATLSLTATARALCLSQDAAKAGKCCPRHKHDLGVAALARVVKNQTSTTFFILLAYMPWLKLCCSAAAAGLLRLQRGAKLRIGLKKVAHAQALAEGVDGGAQGERTERWRGGGESERGWAGGGGGVGEGERRVGGVGGALRHLQSRRRRAAQERGNRTGKQWCERGGRREV